MKRTIIIITVAHSGLKIGWIHQESGLALQIKSNQIKILFITLPGASKIKVKNVNKKRMATARKQIFFGISQGIHC